MKIKRYFLILFFFVILLLSSCTKSKKEDNKKEDLYPTYTFKENADMSKINGYPWIDFTRPGVINMVEKPELKNDFYAYVNYDELSNIDMTDKMVSGGMYESTNTTYANIDYLLQGSSDSIYSNILSNIYNAYKNRNVSLEKAYIKSKIDEIMAINTTDGIFDYIFSDAGIANPSNPFHIRENEEYDIEIYNKNYTLDYVYLNMMVYMGKKDLTSTVQIVKNCLTKFGFDEAIAYNISNVGFTEDYNNSLYYASSYSTDVVRCFKYNLSYKKLYDYLINLGYNDDSTVKYDNSLYEFIRYTDQTDVEYTKAILAYRFAFSHIFCLDVSDYREIISPIYKAILGTDVNIYDDKTLMYDFLMNYFTELLDKCYIDEFLSDNSLKNKITSLTNEIINEYKNLINSQDWLNETSRENLNKKLNNMRAECVYPDYKKSVPEFVDSGNDLFAKYIGTYTLWESKIAGNTTRNLWISSITVANATYMPNTNSITIFAGLLSDSNFINDNRIIEEVYGSIGFIIAHEISHAFDNNGIYFNENGEYQKILDNDEFFSYNIKIINMELAYNKLKYTSSKRVPGITVVSEAFADIGGLKIMLELAKKQDNFDYELFFESFAKTLACVYTEKLYQSNTLYEDSHPLPMIRVNYTVNQFEEFYETYDIKDGDLMYLAPDKRIGIWK